MKDPAIRWEQVDDRFACLMRVHRNTMRRYFQSIGMFNGHPFMLFHIRKSPGITQKALAAHMEISPPSVAVSVRRLESAGLVRREADQKDGRVTHLYLTPKGEDMDTACGHGKDFLVGSMYEGLTPEDAAQLYRLLGKMTENLERAGAALSVPEMPDERKG